MIRKLFFIGNFAVFLLFLVAVWKDYNREWKRYQAQYNKLDLAAAQTPELKKAVKSRSLEIKQMMIDDLGRVDRCITCHVGMDSFTSPTLTNDFKDNPYKSHPLNIVKSHPFDKFGCSVCHAGQGLATTVKGAHGEVHHWEDPMLRGPLLQASCAKCHANFEKLPGAETVALGRKLFKENGCIGCHAINGEGGVISEDLGAVADKPWVRIDLSNTELPKEEWTIQNWVRLHFTEAPAKLVPGDPEGKFGEPIAPSGMPDFDFTKEEAEALTAYMMSLTHDKIPKDYYVYSAPEPEPKFGSAVAHGQYVFQKYGCIGCHGKGGTQGRKNFNSQGGEVPTLVKTVGTYTRDELRTKISNGVPVIVKDNESGPTPPLYMPTWKDKIKGQELEDLISYLQSIAEKDEAW